MTTKLRLDVLPGRYAVARLDPAAPTPAWAQTAGFTCVTRTPDELSIVCAEDAVPAGVTVERAFRCLRVAGPLDFAMTGVLAAIAQPLADAGVSIFAVSTFDTDYVLVRDDDLAAATAALRAAGHGVAGG